MEPRVKRFALAIEDGAPAHRSQAMRHLLTTLLVVTVFSFGMCASMAQQLKQIDPGTIQVQPPPQTPPMQIQTQPAPIPNLNTSKNPYERKRQEIPSQQK